MKKTILALAATIVAGSALAQVTVTPATGSVNGSATSQVSGATSSFSVANMPGQTSFHGSIATAQNCTTVVGVARPGTNGAYAGTAAVTIGSTYTAGGGSGVGGTYAGASQFGFGTVTATANVGAGMPVGDAAPGSNPYGVVSATSTVATGSMSTIETADGGIASSGTIAGAANVAVALAGSTALENGVSVRTFGLTAGVDGIKTFGNTDATNGTALNSATGTLVIGEGEGAVTGVGSFQSGSFNAVIVRNFTASPEGVGGPGGCVGGKCGGNDDPKDPEDPEKPAKGPKGNNGWGNGAEGTNSGSDEGGTKGSKIDELWTSGDGPKPPKFLKR